MSRCCLLVNGSLASSNIAMNDDFNTSDALALMFELANEINRSGKTHLIASLQAMGDILGILQLDPLMFLQK